MLRSTRHALVSRTPAALGLASVRKTAAFASAAAIDTRVTHPDHDPRDATTAAFLAENAPHLLNVYAKPPVVIARGKGAYLYDMAGRQYLDYTAGIAVCALGHADPAVAQVAAQQAGELVHISNLFHNPNATLLARKLIDAANIHSPNAFQSVFFTNSGTEANEGAFKIARKYARDRSGGVSGKKYGIVAFDGAFHGRTMGALAATANKKYREPFHPLVPGVTHSPYGQIEGLENCIKEDTCAVIIEPIQGEGGVVEASEPFLRRIRQLCTQHDVLLIYDEIQCGLGRTGKLWGHEHFPSDLTPDILTIAKPLANGFPIGAILASPRAAACMGAGDHGTTFGGSPFVTRVALHVLDRINNPEFLGRVNAVGEALRTELCGVASEFPDFVKEVRGRGLLNAVEMQEEAMVGRVVNAARERGLLLVGAGRKSVRVVPPLTIGEKEVAEGVRIWRNVLASMRE